MFPAQRLFGAPGSSSQTFDSYVEQSGRVETIWFPFTSAPWLKVWTVSPQKPLLSREVTTPYNYVFADVIPQTLSGLIKEILDGDVAVTPTFGQAELDIVTAGLLGTLTADIWGWAKDLLLYVKPSTLRVTANGYAVLTNRANIQQVIYDFTTYYQSQVAAYQAQGNYPMNGPVEIRVTGLDQPADVEIASATVPTAVGPAPPAGSTRLGRGRLVRHSHHAGHPTVGPVLSGRRTVDVQPLHRLLCRGPAGVVQGMGLHRHCGVVRSHHAGHHHPRCHQRRPERRRQLELSAGHPRCLRPLQGVQQRISRHLHAVGSGPAGHTRSRSCQVRRTFASAQWHGGPR